MNAIEFVNLILLLMIVVLVIDSVQRNARIEKLLRRLLDSVVEFQPGEEFDPDPPKGLEARITRAAFVRKTGMRRPVRRYDIEEDANNPLRD